MLIEETDYLGGESLIFHVDFKVLREHERRRPKRILPRKMAEPPFGIKKPPEALPSK